MDIAEVVKLLLTEKLMAFIGSVDLPILTWLSTPLGMFETLITAASTDLYVVMFIGVYLVTVLFLLIDACTYIICVVVLFTMFVLLNALLMNNTDALSAIGTENISLLSGLTFTFFSALMSTVVLDSVPMAVHSAEEAVALLCVIELVLGSGAYPVGV